jgi:hypothetical protein
MIDRWLFLATQLSVIGKHSPIHKRRAVSTAYYAVFHALARCCADELWGAADRSSREYERVYRALDHGPLRSAFASAPLKDNPMLAEIGGYVLTLQSARHHADYSPPGKLFTPAQCEELIQTAWTAITLLDDLDSKDRRMLSVYLLFKNRPS